jgi:hypothetical protein
MIQSYRIRSRTNDRESKRVDPILMKQQHLFHNKIDLGQSNCHRVKPKI